MVKIIKTPQLLIKRQATCPKCSWVSPAIEGTNFVNSTYTKHQLLKHKRKK